MDTNIEKRNDNELYINISIDKDDYSKEFKEVFHNYKDNVKAKGFRDKNINIDVLFRDLGKKIFNNIINSKISEEFKKIETENKKNNLFLNYPVLVETSYKDKEIMTYNDFNNIKTLNFKYISFTNEISNLEDICKKLKSLNLENLICTEIDKESLFKNSSKLLFSYYISKAITTPVENSAVLLTSTNNEEIVLSVGNTYINKEPLDLLNKNLNDTINININSASDINTNDKILDYINLNGNITPGEKEFKITKIFAKNSHLNIEDIINSLRIFIELRNKFPEKPWLSDFMNINIIHPEEFKNENNLITVEDHILISEVFVYVSNYILSKINIFNLKTSILDVFNFSIPKEYIDGKLNMLGIENNINTNEELIENFREIIKNEIILNSITEIIIADKNIEITEEDIKNYIEIDNKMRDTQFDSILNNYYNKNSKHKFITSKNTYKELIIDSKIMYELKHLLNIPNKEISYKDFLTLTQI